jgi:hypothetical protein
MFYCQERLPRNHRQQSRNQTRRTSGELFLIKKLEHGTK